MAQLQFYIKMKSELNKYGFVENVSTNSFLEEELPYYTDIYELITAYGEPIIFP